jgi:hypothetical protein
MGKVDKPSEGKYTKRGREGLNTSRRRAQEQQREMEQFCHCITHPGKNVNG